MSRSYSMQGVQLTADRAVHLAKTYLRTLDPGARLHDVQEDPRFQDRGVDLLWDRTDGTVTGVEVKGDRQGRRGNYFFELVSNVERNTPGCFLYSTADLYLYVFVDRSEVHHLPLAEVRAWFLAHAKQFDLRHTQTASGQVRYTTVGALVPVEQLFAQVPEAGRFQVNLETGAVAKVVDRRSRLRPAKGPIPSP